MTGICVACGGRVVRHGSGMRCERCGQVFGGAGHQASTCAICGGVSDLVPLLAFGRVKPVGWLTMCCGAKVELQVAHTEGPYR